MVTGIEAQITDHSTMIALLTSVFAIILGSAIVYRLRQETGEIWWQGVAVASLVSGISLAAGAQYLLRRLRVAPRRLLRASG